MSKTILLCPGPVMVEQPVKDALLHYEICHRTPEFEALFARLQAGVLKLFQADESYYALLISGSGTSANETVLSSVFKPGEAALLINNGEFGGRLKEILNKYQVPTYEVTAPWGGDPDLAQAEELLKAHPEISYICMVFHETSTSMINPVKEVGELAAKYGRHFFTDCTSAVGGQFIDVVHNHIDMCIGVGGKCVGAFPGAAFVCGKEALMKEISPEQGKNVYLNLAKHYLKAKECHQTPNTPNVTLFWALEAALRLTLEEETLEGKIARYQHCAGILRQGMRELGLRFLLPEDKMANTVTSVFLPKDKPVREFIAAILQEGYTVYEGKGHLLTENMFQVANMGAIYPEDCYRFLEALKRTL